MFLFQIGTEEQPFQHKGIITMYGEVRSRELPVYGAKTLAVRHGTLELHGTYISLIHLEFLQVSVILVYHGGISAIHHMS